MTETPLTQQQRQNLTLLRHALAAAEIGPSPSDRAAAPVLNLWQIVLIEEAIYLAGLVEDHPEVRPGVIVTSRLVALSPDLNWARTLSRFYRLGPSLETSIALVKERHSTPREGSLGYGFPVVPLEVATAWLGKFQEMIRQNTLTS